MRVKQVDTVLDLLEAFRKQRRPLTLTRISEDLGQPMSSMHNLVETLKARGYLYEVRQRGGFYPSRKLHDLMVEVVQGDPIVHLVHEHLEELANESGETTLLGIRDGNDLLYIDVVESRLPIRYFAAAGDRRPVYATSGGKAILSTYDDDRLELEAKALDFSDRRERTITDPTMLVADIRSGREQGWFVNATEYTADVTGIGMPLLVDGRRLALSIAGPNYRLDGHHEAIAQVIGHRIEKIRQSLEEAGIS